MDPKSNRSTTFETLEPRLVMSAQALTDFVADFHADTPVVDIDQQIETLSASGGGEQFSNDIQAIRDQYNLNGDGQTIAVIDSGIAFDHIAFGGGLGENYRVVGGYDFAENDSNPYDDGPLGLHGTHVAGILGGASDDYAGVSPGVDLVSLRVFDDNGRGELEWVEQALQWVHEHRNEFENPITTVNLSIGTDWNADTVPDAAQLEDEFAQLKADGIFISVAAGNLFQDYNETGVSYPAASPFVIPVASHGADGALSDFSQRNDRVLVAPGENILSTVPDHIFQGSDSDGYLRSTGTSQAAPFVAGASALLREALEFTGVENVDQDLLYEHFRETADLIHDQATGGYFHRINLDRAIAAAIVDDHGDARSTSTDAGILRGGETIRGTIGTIDDTDYFVFRAEESGTVHFTVGTSHDLIPEFGTDHSGANQQSNQISFSVVAGNEYHFSIGSGAGTGNYEIDVTMSAAPVSNSPISIQNGLLVVNGTSGDDNIQFHQGSVLDIVVNGESYQVNPNQISDIVVIGGSGNDSITASFDAEIDRAVLRPSRLDVTGPSVDFVARGFESIDVSVGQNAGLLIVHDSSGHDVFNANFDSVTATGTGFDNSASGFARVSIVASEGSDRITLTGSEGDDRFFANDGRNVLRSGTDRIATIGFDSTGVIASAGEDIAVLHDSAGNDSFELVGRSFQVDTNNYQIWGSSFERITAKTSSGFDIVEIKGTDADDKLNHRTEKTRLSSQYYTNIAKGFDQIVVHAYGGQDTARIYDSIGNDSFFFNTSQVRFESDSQILLATGMNRINTYSSAGGFDSATLIGTGGSDFVTASETSVRLETANGIQVSLWNHEHVVIDTLGGFDSSQLTGGEQRDLLRSISNGLEFESTVQMLRLVNAESHYFDGGGGVDEVVFSDFDSLDLLAAVGDRATAYLGQQQIHVTDIDFLEARARTGETGFYDTDAVDFLFLLDGDWQENESP